MVAVLESLSGSLVGAVATSDRKKLQLSSGGFFFGVRTEKGGVASSYQRRCVGQLVSLLRSRLRQDRRQRCASWICC
jgi:hypothetical protein